MTMQYQELLPLSRPEAEPMLSSGDEHKICEALLRLAYYDPEWHWVQNQCLHLILSHSHLPIRATAVLCLGHLARIHGRLELEKVQPVLMALVNIPELRGRVEDVLEDIAMFIDHSPKELGVALAA